jgi:hypothetical protein
MKIKVIAAGTSLAAFVSLGVPSTGSAESLLAQEKVEQVAEKKTDKKDDKKKDEKKKDDKKKDEATCGDGDCGDEGDCGGKDGEKDKKK